MQALLIGRHYHLQWVLPQILAEAGFSVDVLTSAPILRHSRFVRECESVAVSESLVARAAKRLERGYDWILVTEDSTLREIASSDLSLEAKLKLLPVLREENFLHLYSKIGLFQVLSKGGVRTPPSCVAHDWKGVLKGAEELGYPVLLKKDASGGGGGILECRNSSDIVSLRKEEWDLPLLVQKKLEGTELDLSALYLQEDLVHFSHSIPKRVMSPFGPSSLRIYRPLGQVEREVFEELRHLGKVLGVHGFTNISCMQTPDGKRWYFEADLRTNAWVYASGFLGESIALRIQRWFSHREKLGDPSMHFSEAPEEKILPYLLRLNPREVLCNRYRAWNFLPKKDRGLFIRVFLTEFIGLKIREKMAFWAKKVIPKRYHAAVKRIVRFI